MGTCLKNKVFSKSKVSIKIINKNLSPTLIFFIEKKSERFHWFSTLKNDFENQNFAIFEELLNNFVRSDNDVIQWKNDTGTPPLTRFFGPRKNRVKGNPRYRRSILVLKPKKGENESSKSIFFMSY